MNQMTHHKTDVLVIGAGPSGAVAAAIADKKGLDVLVVEKKHFPRFVIGESLLPSCMESLKEADFFDALQKEKFQLKIGARFIKGDKECLFKFSEQFTKGWEWTWQVPRERFDTVMTEQLQERGVDIWFGHGVTDVKFNGSDSCTTVVDDQGNEKFIDAKFVIDASGYGRVIPKLLDLVEPSNFPARRSFFTRIKDINRPESLEGRQATFVVLEREVWMWVIPFSNGITSVGFVGDEEYFLGKDEAAMRQMIENVPQMAERFRGQEHVMPCQTIRGFASGVKKLYGDGFALAGNSAEFLDPIFSSGVALGILTGHRAADLAAAQLSGETVDWETDFADHINQGVDTFRSYVKHWYNGSMRAAFFSPTEINQKIKNQICSVLAGYVWDKSNPYVAKHEKAMTVLEKVIHMYS